MPKLPQALWGIMIAYIALAVTYAVVTPVFEKSDENMHFAFSMYLAETSQLPVETVEESNHQAEREGSQPPLYYAVLAGILKISGVNQLQSGFDQLTRRNPQYGGQSSIWPDNANRFVHGHCSGACRETTVAVYVGRSLSMLFGLVALVGAAACIHLAFPKRPYLLLAVVAAIGFNPQFLHITSSVSNDAAIVAAVNLAFALGLWWLHRPESKVRALALGSVVGLAALSKVSGLSVLAVLGVLLVIDGRVDWRIRLRQVAFFGGAAALVSGWWYVRNWLLYGEPTATRIHLQITGVEAPPLTRQRFISEWLGAANSFWASFGWGGITLQSEVYRVATGMAVLFAVLFVSWALHDWRNWDRYQRALIGLSGLQLLLVGSLLAGWMRMTEAPLGRLLFPAILPIAVILVLGLLSVVPRRLYCLVVTLFVIIWAGTALILAATLIYPAYRPPEPMLPVQIGPAQIEFADGRALIRDIVRSEDADWLYVQFHWQVDSPLAHDYQMFIHGLNSSGAIVAQRDSHPGLGNRPTTTWRAGDEFADIYTLPKPHDQSIDRLAVGLYLARSGTWDRTSARSEYFDVADNAVQIPLDTIRYVTLD